MRVEAEKVKKGFLIPFVNSLKNINKSKILLDVEIVDERNDEIDCFFNKFHIDVQQLRFSREEANER
jgi:hypothetical protein